jgi:hypothetical protein
MTQDFIELTEDEFDNRYQLVQNHLNPNASWAFGNGPGCLFETYGEELALVRQQDPLTVWTLVDGDDGDQYLISGYHLVNRIGYLITTTPIAEGTEIEVRIPMHTNKGVESGEPEYVAHSIPDLLAQIALQHLNVPTLEPRRSDRLDFHEVAVWCVKDALKAAYEAGAKSGSPLASREEVLPEPAAEVPVPFDGYEIHGVREFQDEHERFCEQVPDHEAEFWSLYGHIPGQRLECNGDFRTREAAEEVFARITGRSYNDATLKANR